jgi:hypothetical protein
MDSGAITASNIDKGCNIMQRYECRLLHIKNNLIASILETSPVGSLFLS